MRIIRNIFRRYIRPIYIISRNTVQFYLSDKVQRMGAALAYYTIFSLPAIIIIIIGLVGFFLGEASIEDEINHFLKDFIGADAAGQVQDAVKKIGTRQTNWWATVLGIGFLIFIATNIFYALQEVLNSIFDVAEMPRKMNFVQALINRSLSFGLILSISALLVVSILVNGLLLGLSNYIQGNEEWLISKMPEGWEPIIEFLSHNFIVLLNLGVSIFIIAVFFMLLYKILPAVHLRWRYIWAGSVLAAVLFLIGELLLGYYLSNAGFIGAYGAAGSLIVLLIWVFYSAQLVFIGAEFIKALCKYRGVVMRPKAYARKIRNNQRKRIRKRRKKDSEGNIVEFYDSPLPLKG